MSTSRSRVRAARSLVSSARLASCARRVASCAWLAVSCAWLVVSCVLPTHAFALEAAEPEGAETASLGWSRLPGAEGCATAIELGEAVEAILARDVLVAAPDAALSLEGRIERTEHGYRATIAVTRRDGASEGERVYDHEGPDCRDATEPLALILALLIDPDASLEAPHAPPVEETGSSTAAGSSTATESSTATGSSLGAAVETGPAPFGVALDVSGMLAAFLTPSAAPAGRAAVHLRFPSGPLPLAVVVAGWLSPWSRAQVGDAWADFLFAVGGAGLCAVPQLTSWLDLSVCVLGEAGGAFVIGTRTLVPDERERVVFFVEAAVTLRAHVYDALTVHLGASLGVPFRTEPWLAASSAYWRPDPAGLFVFLGVGFDLGVGR